jgi:hypothetical protein
MESCSGLATRWWTDLHTSGRPIDNLIDNRPQDSDSQHHASHLIITSAERAQLLSDIATGFGSKLDQKEQNFTVSAASVLRAYLLKDFKASDDPWE